VVIIFSTYVFIYDSFAQFEVILANYFLKHKGEVITFGIDNDKVTSHEEFIIVPHKSIDEVDVDDIDLLVIPGGDPSKVNDKEKLYSLIKEVNKKDKFIGAICAAPVHLSKAGILNNRKYTTTLDINSIEEFNVENFIDKNVVIDKNIITAKASGYVDFALELGKKVEVFENEEDLNETIRFFKYFNEEK
jgi:putative intracellular protease/amidase